MDGFENGQQKYTVLYKCLQNSVYGCDFAAQPESGNKTRGVNCENSSDMQTFTQWLTLSLQCSNKSEGDVISKNNKWLNSECNMTM